MKTIKLFFLATAGLLLSEGASAQLNLLNASYYANQYLSNPAMAGTTGGLNLNLNVRKLWTNVPGSPATQSLSGEYSLNRVGLGLLLYNETAGLQKQLRTMATYAYHLPITSASTLSFGLSAGLLAQRLDNTSVSGNPNDVLIGAYNQRKTYFDADFGIAYTNKKLSLQAAVPNLKKKLKRDEVVVTDEGTFYTSVSYRFGLGGQGKALEVEPKVAYRGINGLDNIFDIGAQFALVDRQLLLSAVYHSTKNASLGLGVNIKTNFHINLGYITQTSSLSNYTNGSFEIGLGLRL